MSSAKGYQTVLFACRCAARSSGEGQELGESLATVHRLLNFTLAGLVLSHAAAAIKHHFGDRDDVLKRMLPFLKNA